MTDLYQFASDSPWLAFFLACLAVCLLEEIFFRLPNRIMRHININKHGYPPPHCDADGDFKEDSK